MDLNSVLQLFTDHQAVLAALPSLALSAAHSRLARWPIAQVLARYAGVLPIARIAAVELAQAVVAQWGPQAQADVAQVALDLQFQEQATVTGSVTKQEPPPGPNGPSSPCSVTEGPLSFDVSALAAAHPELVKKAVPPYGG